MAMRGMALHVTSADLRLASRIDRVTRFIRARKYFDDVEIAGIRAGDLAAVEVQDDGRVYRRFRVRKSLRKASRFTRAFDFSIWYVQVAAFYLFRPVTCVNAHTLAVLPLCWFLSVVKRCKLVYEPHELETETMTVRGAMRPVLKLAERLFIRGADAVVLVNSAIGEWYREAYRLKRAYVVRNLPQSRLFHPLPPHYYAARYGFSATDLVFVYQGLLDEGRGIELLLDAAAQLPADRHIVFLGFGPLTEKVTAAAERLANVHYHPAVPNAELLRYSAAADAGLIMAENISLSYRYSYPNKYCEYQTAGIPLICTDFFLFRSEIEKYGSGWTCPYDARALAKLLTSLDRGALGERKSGAAAWARDNSWQNEEKVLGEIYAALGAVRA
jgi:glycosyltransferase involved in cell wall biosynthesis